MIKGDPEQRSFFAGRTRIGWFAWRFAVPGLSLLALVACVMFGQPVAIPMQDDSGTIYPEASLEPTLILLTAEPFILPAGLNGIPSAVVWPAGVDKIVVAGDETVALVPYSASGVEPQTATLPAPLVYDANLPSLLAAAQDEAITGWVDGQNNVFTFDASSGGERPVQIASSITPVTGIAISPDGGSLAYSTSDGRLVVIPRGGQPEPQLLDGWEVQSWLTSLSYSPDEKHIAGLNPSTFTVYIIDSATGQTQRTLEWVDSPLSSLYFTDFSPDWSQVAWVAQTAVQLMNVSNGELGPLLNHPDHVSASAWSPDGARLATTSAELVGGSLASRVVIWDASTGERLETRNVETTVVGLAFSPDGTQIAALDGAGNLLIWDLEQ